MDAVHISMSQKLNVVRRTVLGKKVKNSTNIGQDQNDSRLSPVSLQQWVSFHSVAGNILY